MMKQEDTKRILIALAQCICVKDLEENIRTVCRVSRDAAALGCAAICFPESFLTGYHSGKDAASFAIGAEDRRLAAIADTARQAGIDILVGFAERLDPFAGAGSSVESSGESSDESSDAGLPDTDQEASDEDMQSCPAAKTEGGFRLYLTQTLFRKDGSRFLYRKTHLGEKEKLVYEAGNELPVFRLSCGLQAGFALCVETHFPDLIQTLSLKGAEIVFAPHAVPDRSGNRKAIWDRFIPARSYDNRVYMACCNLKDGEHLPGGCMVTDPAGEILAEDYPGAEGLGEMQEENFLGAEGPGEMQEEDCRGAEGPGEIQQESGENGSRKGALPQAEFLMFEADPSKVARYHQEGGRSMRFRYYPGQRRPELYHLS